MVSKLRKIPWAPPSIGNEERKAAIKVINSEWMTQGKITESLEKKICETLGSKYAVVTNSGTSALICSLIAHGIGFGDEVIVPSFTFVATVNSILTVGAKPVLVDSDPRTFNTNPNFIKRTLTPKTRAILPVDVSGMPIDIIAFRKFAEKHNLILIEDAAEGIGGQYNNKKIGSFGHSTIFSFHMAKVVTGIEGGCVVTDDKKIASMVRLARSHGDVGQYNSTIFGLNFRISDVHSAIALEQIKKMNRFLKHRQKIASLYKDELSSYEFQEIPDFVTLHPYMLFAMLVTPKKRNKLKEFLWKNGVDTRICWLPVHKQPYHSKLFNQNRLPESELIYSKIINLPMGNGLSEKDANHVVDLIKKAC